MADGLVVYENDSKDKITLYKIYSRSDVEYKAQFILSDINGNSISRIFPWESLGNTYGKAKLKRAFLGKGLQPIGDKDIDKIYVAFLNAQSNISSLTVGQSSRTSISFLKKQLKKWYDSTENTELTSMVVDVEGGGQYDVINKNFVDDKSNINDKSNTDDNGNTDVTDNTKDNNNTDNQDNEQTDSPKILIYREKIDVDNVLLISTDAFKKWLSWIGYQPNPFLKKMVSVGVVYEPSPGAPPRYHKSKSGDWYRAIYIDKLDLLDLIV